MTAMGVIIDQFSVPVCNSFQDKILNDQLCYEVDPNQYKNINHDQIDLSLGLVFIMDYNEDRQMMLHSAQNILDFLVSFEGESLVANVEGNYENKNAFILLNTIGTL